MFRNQATLLLALLAMTQIINAHSQSKEQSKWFDAGIGELRAALNVKINENRAKNVILFIGDGMDPNTVTAARIYKAGEEGELTWERFPHTALIKTYCSDMQTCDSGATSTALFGGVKTNMNNLGVDASVPVSNCRASLDESTHVHTVLQWAQDAGMSTGFVTNTRVMHATPGGLYAHSPDRRWECEATMPQHSKDEGCKDIARQLIEDLPGRNINVIMGGGRQLLVSNSSGTEIDPINGWACNSMDGRNLIEDWKNEKVARGVPHAYVENTGELNNLVADDVDYVLGIFSNGHLAYDHERNRSPAGMPSLSEMTLKAISILEKNPNGFFLMVEGGLIDLAHHRGWARVALNETLALEEAIAATINSVESKLNETLIIVTADHALTMSINGYAQRGSDILGIAQKSVHDEIPYTTLTYSTGGPDGFQVDLNQHGAPIRRDPSHEDTTTFEYIQQVAILTDENTHGGSDLAVYALGPWSHLFHSVHEQSYVAHVISYAARIGQFYNVTGLP